MLRKILTALVSIIAVSSLTACVPYMPSYPSPAPQSPPAQADDAPRVWAATIEYRWSELDEPFQYLLHCSDAEKNTYPGDVEQACAWLDTHYNQLRQYRLGETCTEQYGGPELALVSVVDSTRVKTMHPLKRTNGCYIDQWNAWLPILQPVLDRHPIAARLESA